MRYNPLARWPPVWQPTHVRLAPSASVTTHNLEVPLNQDLPIELWHHDVLCAPPRLGGYHVLTRPSLGPMLEGFDLIVINPVGKRTLNGFHRNDQRTIPVASDE